ncbi:MAG: rod shape-determining protein MreC [Ilumatobacter sp.]|uniref:rod shape-determining protein MreC n=1 Tax=Ilumatobacter sp. TaxID=1967498 RepID=UPI003297A731
MAIYTVGRRRVIISLLLTAVLLLTLDLRGNPVLDTVRDGFSQAMSPVERAADVVTNPVQRGWNAYNNYDDLVTENQVLLDQIDRQRGTQAAAEASIIDYNLLLAFENLPSLAGFPTATAQVVGGATNNIDQTVEINKGSNDGIAVGMPVVNQAGLIGKITRVSTTTSIVMLVTDPRYSIAVEILGGTGETSSLDDGSLDDAATSGTTPSGNTPEENEQLAQDEVDAANAPDSVPSDTSVEVDPTDTVADESDAPGGTTPADVFEQTDPDLPQAGDLPEPGVVSPDVVDLPPAVIPDEDEPPTTDAEGNPVEPTETTTTTIVELIPEQLEKEFGVLEGRGAGKLTQIRFLQDIPSLAVLEEGDLVETAGPSDSPAPPNIPVGRVINRADRPGVAGPLLEIELNADLDKLNFVRVVLFRPLSEAGE